MKGDVRVIALGVTAVALVFGALVAVASLRSASDTHTHQNSARNAHLAKRMVTRDLMAKDDTIAPPRSCSSSFSSTLGVRHQRDFFLLDNRDK